MELMRNKPQDWNNFMDALLSGYWLLLIVYLKSNHFTFHGYLCKISIACVFYLLINVGNILAILNYQILLI